MYVASAVVISTAFFLALGNARGYYASGADARIYFAFQVALRCVEIVYIALVAVFLA
jgi:hypothetical protein